MDEKCAEAEILIQEYLSGCLPDEEKREMFGHIAVCPSCREELAWQNALKKTADTVLSQPPEELRGMIMKEISRQKESVEIIPNGIKEAFTALRSSRDTVVRTFVPVMSCLKLASKCI